MDECDGKRVVCNCASEHGKDPREHECHDCADEDAIEVFAFVKGGIASEEV